MEDIKPIIEEEDGVKIAYLKLCRRIAGRIICEEKGIKVVYRNGVTESVEIIEPKRPGRPRKRWAATLIYEKGSVGPVEVHVKDV